MSVPRAIHHIWLNDDDPPPLLTACRATFAELHPGWKLTLHRDLSLLDHPSLAHIRERIDTWMEKVRSGVKEKRRQLAYIADLYRVCVLHAQGGFYADMDMFAVRSLEAFRGDDLVLMQHAPGKVGEGIIGSPARSHKLYSIIKACVEGKVYEKMSPLNLGPISRHNGWPSYAPEYFCPHPRINPKDLYAATENTHTIHLWFRDHTYEWKKLENIRKAAGSSGR